MGFVIRVFPRRTKWTPDDDLAFVGDPPMYGLPPEMPVRISVAFTWDIQEAMRLKRYWGGLYRDVKVGGPAFGDPGGEFVPGLFVKRGMVITSRGCIRSCPFCLVPQREGSCIRHLKIMDGHTVQDNNLLACDESHIRDVFQMLQKQKEPATFSGGLDARLLKPWHVELLSNARINQMFFACDTPSAIGHLRSASDLLGDFPRYKKRCYVLVGFNGETIRDAEKRCRKVWDLDFLPSAMLYRSGDAKKRIQNREWSAFMKCWSRPAATKAHMKADPTQPMLWGCV